MGGQAQQARRFRADLWLRMADQGFDQTRRLELLWMFLLDLGLREACGDSNGRRNHGDHHAASIAGVRLNFQAYDATR